MENNFKKLGTLIEVLTHSGSNSLDEGTFKEVKKICKSSQDYIPHVYELLLKQLKKNNSQIRLTAFQICKELFSRSGIFRELVIKDLNLIYELTTEINSEKKLPEPKSCAKALTNLAISTLKAWVDEYGEAFKKLKVAYNYFKKCKHVNFETLEVGNSADQIVENEQQRHMRIIIEEKLKKVFDEFNSNKSEIASTITSLSNCLSLLMPPVEDFFIPEHSLAETSAAQSNSHTGCDLDSHSNEDDDVTKMQDRDNEEDESYISSFKSNLRECGISLDYSLTVQLNPNQKIRIEKTEENGSIIENASDCVRLINNRFLPMVKNWIRIFCKHSDRHTDKIKEIINLKEQLDTILKKYSLLIIEGNNTYRHNNNSSDDDEDDEDDDDDNDFEEVKKEGYEDGVEELESVINFFCIKKEEKKSDAAVLSNPSLMNKDVKDSALSLPSTSGESNADLNRKSKLLSLAPKLPYDIDLYHWEDEDLKPPTLISTKMDVDKFWGCSSSDDIHEIPNPDGLAALRTRVIEFSGKFEPVKWACRAPLKNGKLCPRKDRFKCPFHGKIVARDEMGNIKNKEDQKSADLATAGSSTSGWQDLELLNDIEAATGIHLKMPEKKGKRKSEKINLTHKKMKTSAETLRILERKNLPGLSDIVKKRNNAYTRLNKRIFNRSALKRVSTALNKIDRNKFKDKFGDQFNYF